MRLDSALTKRSSPIYLGTKHLDTFWCTGWAWNCQIIFSAGFILKNYRKPKEQSRMDNTEKVTTLGTQDTTLGTQDTGLGTQDTGWRHKKNTTQKTKKMSRTPSLTGGELKCLQRLSSSCILQDTHHVTHLVKTCWTLLYTNTINMASANNWGSRRTEYRFYAEIVADVTTRNLKRKYVFMVFVSF
jgi:hypothetical protein